MELATLLIANGFLLSFILLILLVTMASRKEKPFKRNSIKIRDDLKKIKAQISEDGETMPL